MANTKSAKKQAKRSEKNRAINLARKSDIKTAIKKAIAAIEKNQEIKITQELLLSATSKIARAKNKGVFHSNTADRKISRLTKRFNKQVNTQLNSQATS